MVRPVTIPGSRTPSSVTSSPAPTARAVPARSANTVGARQLRDRATAIHPPADCGGSDLVVTVREERRHDIWGCALVVDLRSFEEISAEFTPLSVGLTRSISSMLWWPTSA